MARAKKNPEVVQETKVEAEDEITSNPEFDMYKAYSEYFEDQQKKILEYWTATLNSMWWWKP